MKLYSYNLFHGKILEMGFDWIPSKNYKKHYVCLKCQKGFKRSSEQDMKHPKSSDLSDLMNEYYSSNKAQDILQYIIEAYQKMDVVCPNCREVMIQVHYNFEVPPQRDYKSWKELQKTMSPTNTIKYDVYREWHRLALKDIDVNSPKFKLLKQNLEKLEKQSAD